MGPDLQLLELLEAVASGRLSVAEALAARAEQSLDGLVRNHGDLSRAARNGFPEVVFAQGKSLPDLLEIVGELARADGRVLITRADADQARALAEHHPELEWHEEARVLRSPPPPAGAGRVAVVAAGSTDRRVAEEAALTAEMFGAEVERLVDVGVAGLHRLLARRELLRAVDVTIVVAGMEGALPSVVGGLVAGPVIAVPSSVGYGAALGGMAALLGMLSSCAPGVVVVNIDNGFGAGFAAGRMLHGRVTRETRATDRSKDAR